MRVTVGPEVAEFVRALALTWKTLGAYPPGHPALRGSMETAYERFKTARGPAAELAFGIAADAIMYGPDRVESAYSQRLAQALYTRGVAVVRFGPETSPRDLEMFLRLLGAGTAEEQAKPFSEQLTAAGVSSINLQAVDYSAVKLTEDLEEKPKNEEKSSLWDDILKALLAGRELTSATRQKLLRGVSSIDDLAAMIKRYVENPARLEAEIYSDAKAGVQLTTALANTGEMQSSMVARLSEAIGNHVAANAGLGRQLAVQQVMQMLRGLPEALRAAVIRSVLRTLATDEASGSLLREMTLNLPANELLDSLRYIGAMSKLSSHATGLLQSLMQAAAPKATESSASPAVLTELVQLFGEDDLDRFNPRDHRELLTEVSIYIPDSKPVSAEQRNQISDRLATVSDDAVHRSFARTLLELIETLGTKQNPEPMFHRLENLFRSFVTNGDFNEAIDLLEQCQTLALTTKNDVLHAAVEASLQRMADPDAIKSLIQSLLSAPPEKNAVIQRLIQAMGKSAMRSLLMSLAEENNRSRRRKLFDFVSSLGPAIVPHVRSFLDDSRWYVVRNMILVLRATKDTTSLPDLRRLAQHRDLRVRLEAIKSLFTLDPSVDRAILENAITDRDPKMAESAIALVGSYGIREGIDPLLNLLKGPDMFGSRRMLRIRAVKALGELGEPSTLSELERFFKDSFLPWPNRAERRAAYESLSGYPREAREAIVERGLTSRDAEIRATCEKLTRST